MSASTGLGDPPASLLGFPEAAPVAELHRLSEFPGSWWFASTEVDDHGGGRFDLPPPQGTCYLADSLTGAIVEKLLRTPVKVVVAERLDELFHTVVTVRRTPTVADLTSRRATGFGLNAEIHSTLEYGRTRRWAAAFHRNGFRGLRHRLRGDVSQRLAGWALFGTAGLRRRAPNGMATAVRPLDRLEVVRVLDRLGVELRPIPAVVPIASPSTPRR
ncbi:MAG: RES family NAD+ phosphorylase [Acidimicrobiales bacterium]|nr:RES family NAD+ phosphorylase [Acidimicrobiales bacterium]MCB9392260.1 RES family NAD+ phosphorylase [Acidimicrobiaceae bacterium]